jgi:hypothetical protein
MKSISTPVTELDKMTKKQLYQFLTDKVLSAAQKEDLKDELLVLEKKISSSSSKDEYIKLINQYNNYTNKFYDTFETLYNRYMLNKKDIILDKKLIDIGIDNINVGYDESYPKKEVFVLLDLIDGEVNDENKKDVYCPYTNEYLGHLLNNLVYNTESSKIVKPTKSIYSVDARTTQNTNNTSTNKPTNQPNNTSINKVNEQSSNNTIDTELFYSQVFNKGENKQILDKMRPFLIDDNVIDFIKKNQELYAVVSKSLSTTSKKRSFIDQINRLNGRYKTEIDILNQSKKDPSQLPVNNKNIDNDILKYEFYSTILDKVMSYENTKPIAIGGKKTKSRKSTSKNTTKKIR